MKPVHEKPINNSNDSFLAAKAGGPKEKWRNESKIGENLLTELPPTGEDLVKQEYDLEHIDRLNFPIYLDPKTANFEDIRNHALLRQRLAPKTTQNHLKYLKFMELHVCPVNLREPSRENFLRHMDYREQVEHCGNGALKHENEAFRMYLRSIGVDPVSYYYKPPKRQNKETPVPYPDQVHRMIHTTYSKDRYINALIRYLLCHNHVIGWRPPSEPAIAKINDVDLDHETLMITSPKLHYTTHTISISEICNQHDNPSLKNWLETWRPMAANQYSQDFLYLRPDGHPFNADSLRSFLYRNAQATIQGIFPGYYNYTSRHFCAIARLIRTKLESGHFDEYEVMNYLGHSKTDVTMTYIKRAKFYYDQTGYDWIKRVLTKTYRWCFGDNAQSIKIDTAQKTGLSICFTPYDIERRPPDSNRRPFG